MPAHNCSATRRPWEKPMTDLHDEHCRLRGVVIQREREVRADWIARGRPKLPFGYVLESRRNPWAVEPMGPWPQ